MVKIIYCLCGEGLGHASRSRILISHLMKKHEIKIFAGGRSFSYMSNIFDDVTKIESLRFVYKKNKVRLFLTIFRTIFYMSFKSVSSYIKIRKEIKEFKPDILITDAEPISFYASFFSDIKRISIDNPQAIIYRKYDVNLGEYLSWFFLYAALKLAIFNADKYIIYDFSDKQIKNPKVLFLKPLIQEGILKQKLDCSDHIFVYQTSISTKYVTDILRKFDERFIIYGFDEERVDGNLKFKRFNEDEFYKDISSAKAVITNGGFTVISEALYLKKPIFSLPIRHQFEQVINGQFVEQLGAGVSYSKLNEKKLKDFLGNLELYKENLGLYGPGDQKQTLQRIEEEINKLLSVS